MDDLIISDMLLMYGSTNIFLFSLWKV